MPMLIREYQSNDKEIVAKFLELQHDDMLAFDPYKRTRKQNFGNFSVENLLKENEDNGRIFVAEINGKVAGYVSGWVKKIDDFPFTTGAPNINGMLDNLFVLPEFRRQGIAAALVNTIEKYFENHECRLVWLNVYSDNKNAINFYNKLDYKSNAVTLIKRLASKGENLRG